MRRTGKPVGLAIIGCGIAARLLHWPALRSLKDRFEIRVVCNHTERKAKEYARLVGGVPYVLDYRDALARGDVEAVDILLPIDMNYRVTRDALRAGKHVLVEKPIAANLQEARAMRAFPGAYRRVMMVAENFRYRRVIQRARALLRQGSIGRPYAAVWDIYHRIVRKDNPYARTSWRIHHTYPGGFLTDAGVHDIAALRFLLGDITSVSALAASINPLIGRLDTMSLRFTTADRLLGVFNLFFASAGRSENRLLLFGRQGTMTLSEHRLTLERPGKKTVRELLRDDGGYREEFEDFYSAIRFGTLPVSSFEEGYRDLEVILAGLASAKSGKPVRLR